MPAFCKVSKASLCFESVTMPDPYQKCNRVATIIKLNEKIMLRDSIHAIIPILNQSAIFVGRACPAYAGLSPSPALAGQFN
jgi:hypothetical protein